MGNKQQVLIVEDDTDTMNLLKQIVLGLGYEPVLAHGGREAVEMLQTTEPDLVLLDLIMRDMDGWTVLMTIKATPNLSDIPVFIISARAPSEHPSRVEALGDLYEAYFIKPFEVDDLARKIQKVLGSHPVG